MSTNRLKSDRMVTQAPMSFAGSAKRIWQPLVWREPKWLSILLANVAVLLILVAWTVVLCWYCTFGLLLVPYRLVRRGSRRDKVAAQRHREMMDGR